MPTMQDDDIEIRASVTGKRLIEAAIDKKKSSTTAKLNEVQMARDAGIAQSAFNLYKRGFFMNAQVQQFMKFLSYLEIDPTLFFTQTGLYKQKRPGG